MSHIQYHLANKDDQEIPDDILQMLHSIIGQRVFIEIILKKFTVHKTT